LRKKVLVFWENTELLKETETSIRRAIDESQLAGEWTVSAHASIYNQKTGDDRVVDRSDTALLILHLNNDKRDGYDFFRDSCVGLPAVLISSGGVERAKLVEGMTDSEVDLVDRSAIFVSRFGSAITNIPRWFREWKQEGFTAESLPKTRRWLEHGEAAEELGLLEDLESVLRCFAILNTRMHHYLMIRGWSPRDGDDSPKSRFKAELIRTRENETLRLKGERLQEALNRTARDRLFKPQADAHGEYWFDDCEEDLRGPSPFNEQTDEWLRRAEAIANSQDGGLGAPDLSMLASDSTGSLKRVWDVAVSHYGSGAASDGDALPECVGDLADLFGEAHMEYVRAAHRVQSYLGTVVR